MSKEEQNELPKPTPIRLTYYLNPYMLAAVIELLNSESFSDIAFEWFEESKLGAYISLFYDESKENTLIPYTVIDHEQEKTLKNIIDTYISDYKENLLENKQYDGTCLVKISAYTFEKSLQNTAQILNDMSESHGTKTITIDFAKFIKENPEAVNEKRFFETLQYFFAHKQIELIDGNIKITGKLDKYISPVKTEYPPFKIKENNSLYKNTKLITKLTPKREALLLHLFKSNGESSLKDAANAVKYAKHFNKRITKKVEFKNVRKKESLRDLAKQINKDLKAFGYSIVVSKTSIALQEHGETVLPIKKKK